MLHHQPGVSILPHWWKCLNINKISKVIKYTFFSYPLIYCLSTPAGAAHSRASKGMGGRKGQSSPACFQGSPIQQGEVENCHSEIILQWKLGTALDF